MPGPTMPAVKVVQFVAEDDGLPVREGWRQTKKFCGDCGKRGVWSGPDDGYRLCTSCGMIGEVNGPEQFPERGTFFAAALAQLRATA